MQYILNIGSNVTCEGLGDYQKNMYLGMIGLLDSKSGVEATKVTCNKLFCRPATVILLKSYS